MDNELNGTIPPAAAGSHITLSEFTRRISERINAQPGLTDVMVVAELSDFAYKGAHAYGQLLEKDPATGKTIASIRATIWNSDLRRITANFLAATGRNIETGMKVLLRLTANHSPQFGLSANIRDIDPSYTLGDMERIRREILGKLAAEGIYDANKRLQLPPAPQRIAVISSAGAAGYGDFVNQLDGSGFKFYPLLYPASMQGERTVPTVLDALDRIEMATDFWDCVVIIRGGGASADLNWFDNINLARRVATFPLPIIVGIGHERDNTVLDYIANTRCKTPTAVAAFLADRLATAETYAEDLTRRILEHTQSALNGESQRLAHLAAMVPIVGPRRLEAEAARLDRLQAQVGQTASAGLVRAERRLTEFTSAIGRGAGVTLTRAASRLDTILPMLRQGAATRFMREADRLNSIKSLIDVLNPQATLRRGYSITRVGGRAVRSAAQLPSGTEIQTVLPDGTVTSTVK
ncbi:MAG: exodeoxyribonuclease VII large subunit [Bacteroides sp.]|nr:exodeoxyribonuclease VII large subunit [Bacteroides sp.]